MRTAQVYRRECMVQELILELDVKWVGKQKFQLQARSSAGSVTCASGWPGLDPRLCNAGVLRDQWAGRRGRMLHGELPGPAAKAPATAVRSARYHYCRYRWALGSCWRATCACAWAWPVPGLGYIV